MLSANGETSSPYKCIFCNKYFDKDTIDQHANWCFESQRADDDQPLSTPSNANQSINSNASFADHFIVSQNAKSSSNSTSKSKKTTKRNSLINLNASNSSSSSSSKKLKANHSEIPNSNARQTKLSFYHQDQAEFAYVASSQSTANNVKKEMKKWQLEPSQQLYDDVIATESRLDQHQSVVRKKKVKSSTPLADKVRPDILDHYVGQDQILGDNTSLRSLIQSGDIHSMIFWGPPGCGKVRIQLQMTLNQGYIYTILTLMHGHLCQHLLLYG